MATETIGRKTVLGLSAVVAASILFSAKSVFFKMCYRYGTEPIVLQTLRGAFSMPFFLWPLLAGRFRRPGPASAPAARAPLTGRDKAMMAWLGFSGYYLASIFDMVGLQYVSAGTERLILFVYPTLVVLFSALIFRKRIPGTMYLPLGLTYAGIALSFGWEAAGPASGTPGPAGGKPFLGGSLVFLSAVFYALFLVGQGRMMGRMGPQLLSAGCMAVSTVCIFAQFLIGYPLGALAQPAPVYWIAGLTSVFCSVVPVYLYGYGVHMVGAGRAAVVSSVGPVSTMVLAGALLGEGAGFFQWAGLGLVVAGSLKLGMGKPKADAKAEPAPVQGAAGSCAAAGSAVSPASRGRGRA